MKFNICPRCGAHLDFGEPCDCKEEQTTPKAAAKTGVKKVRPTSENVNRTSTDPYCTTLAQKMQ